MNKEAEINKELIKVLKEKIQLLEEQKLNSQEIINAQKEQLILYGVSNCKRDETLELLEEIMTKVKEADSEVENGIYDPMLECAKHILNNYKIERR